MSSIINKSLNVCRFINLYVLKLYEARRLKNHLRGSNFVQKLGPNKGVNVCLEIIEIVLENLKNRGICWELMDA